MKLKRYLIIAIGISLFTTACVEKNYNYDPNSSTSESKIVTNTPTQILSFTNAKTLAPGTILKLRLNRNGSVVKEYNVKFEGTYEMDGEQLIFCTTSDKLVVGQGDSGSPLLTSDGKVIGALCYGFYFSNYQFAARAIEDMIDTDTSKVSTKSVKLGSNLFKNIGAVNYVIGANAESWNRYAPNGNSVFDENIQFLNNRKSVLKSGNTTNNAIPGNSIAINIIQGDIFTVGAIGTLSHLTSKNKYLAFGHSFGISPISARATTADMVTMINSSEIAYKIAIPTTQSIGSLITDTDFGIVIDPLATPQEYVHKLSFRMKGKMAETLGDSIYATHYVANFLNTDQEYYYAGAITASPLYSMIIYKGFYSLKATCYLNVKFKNAPELNSTFDEYSSDGWLDSYIYSDIRMKIMNHFAGETPDNITSFKIDVDLSEYISNY